jgi:hypothetical protein
MHIHFFTRISGENINVLSLRIHSALLTERPINPSVNPFNLGKVVSKDTLEITIKKGFPLLSTCSPLLFESVVFFELETFVIVRLYSKPLYKTTMNDKLKIRINQFLKFIRTGVNDSPFFIMVWIMPRAFTSCFVSDVHVISFQLKVRLPHHKGHTLIRQVNRGSRTPMEVQTLALIPSFSFHPTNPFIPPPFPEKP